jgi:hypothetical protein
VEGYDTVGGLLGQSAGASIIVCKALTQIKGILTWVVLLVHRAKALFQSAIPQEQ